MTDQDADASVLIVISDAIVRNALAAYLRGGGYRVIETVSSDEAMLALAEPSLLLGTLFCHFSVRGSLRGFELATWAHQNRPELRVRLAASVERAAKLAADLCEAGPQQAAPYQPQIVVDYVKRCKATQQRNRQREL